MDPEEKQGAETSTAENETAVGAVDDIAEATAESASEPNEAAIAALRNEHLQTAPAVRTISTDRSTSTESPRDSKGNTFDPNVHHANPDGSPKLYNGKLRRKKASKVEGANSASSVGTQSVGTPTALTQMPSRELSAVDRAAARASGHKAADGFITMAQMIGGPEFAPIVDGKFESTGPDGMPEYNERKLLREAFADIAEHYGVTKFSPVWGLLLTTGVYVGIRLRMEQTQSRLQKLKSWAYAKIGQWKGKRHAARTNSRNHDERKEHASLGAREGGTKSGPQVNRP